MAPSLCRRWERLVNESDKAAAPKASYELFSLPFSQWGPEAHPWAAAADIVNVHWVSGALDWPRFFAAIRLPVVFTLHDQHSYLGGFHYTYDKDANTHLAEPDAKIRALKQNAIQGRRITVVGNSRWNMQSAQTSGFFPPQTRFETIYYPLDTRVYQPQPKPQARAALSLPLNRLVIGFAATDVGNRRKGFDTLLEAIRGLPGSLQNQVHLLSFGREPSEQLRASVVVPWKHIGYLEDDDAKVTAYSAMDIFIMPSRAEAFGQAAIEALACGTPVVGADTGGIPEALDGGRCGALFTPGDATDLARKIEELFNGAHIRAALTSAGRTHVITAHDPAECARRYREVYGELAIRNVKPTR
jgi:glycosyltransferase involved in cell wall biosynthesis